MRHILDAASQCKNRDDADRPKDFHSLLNSMHGRSIHARWMFFHCCRGGPSQQRSELDCRVAACPLVHVAAQGPTRGGLEGLPDVI